ncbi:MAG: M3 family metallopeptidase [Mucinivorans sp.]
MKKIAILLTTMVTTLASMAGNPLLEERWTTPHETPPFALIKPEHFIPAIEQQIQHARQRLNMIVMQRSVPTFENTIVALETNDHLLARTLGVFYNLNSAETTPELQKIALEISPILTAYGNDVSLNEGLFQKVKQVYDRRAELALSVEDAMLLEKTYKSFARSGANLVGADRDKYRALTAELAELSVKFDQNELAATNAFSLLLTRKADLKGLPASWIEAAQEAAKAKGKRGYLVTLDYPSYVPFIKYAESASLRRAVWQAKATLCATDGPNDNRQTVKRIANLRLELANLLGYNTYADYALEERMAKSANKVNSFLGELLTKTFDYAKKDLALISDYAAASGFKEQLMPWDFSYWNEKFSTATFSVNDEMTRPYFRIQDAEKALFLLAGKLYGLEFRANADIPTYHPDVLAYDVFDRSGEFLAVLYCDYFPRAGKNSGAWMNTFREGSIDAQGNQVRPIVVLVNNFTKPTESTPSLLSFNEFQTMLHEFGHGLHGMFAKGKYASLTGTNVYRDFVELPSQIMENWAYEKEFLDLFATHYQSGEKMPTELIDKLIAAKNHLAAYDNVSQLRYAMNDMAWHSITSPIDSSTTAEQFERAATASTQLMPVVAGTLMSPAFGHIFAGGYAAGYYSYKWAELLEANAFKKFKTAGVFDPVTAASFRRNILEVGGTEDPMAIFVRFNGGEPTIEPLMEKMGLK